MPSRRGARFARRRWMGADGDGGSKRRGNLPTQNDTRDGMLTYFDVGSEEAVEGPDFWLKTSHTYQAREVQEPEKNNIINSEKEGSGMVEVGRRVEVASPPKPIVGLKRVCPENNYLRLKKWERCDVVMGWEGRGNEPT